MARVSLTRPQLLALGQRLAARRLQLRLTRQALADATGLSRTTLLNLERASGQQPTASTLALLAVALHTSPAALISLEGAAPAPGVSPAAAPSAADAARLEVWALMQDLGLASIERLKAFATQYREMEQALDVAAQHPTRRAR